MVRPLLCARPSHAGWLLLARSLARSPRRAQHEHSTGTRFLGGSSTAIRLPLQHWLVTPELQWQSRGGTAYLTGAGCPGDEEVYQGGFTQGMSTVLVDRYLTAPSALAADP